LLDLRQREKYANVCMYAWSACNGSQCGSDSSGVRELVKFSSYSRVVFLDSICIYRICQFFPVH
ncbi:Peptidyl-prolyl cis-trans isomerase (PPIase), partial [Psidium guajava]